MSGVVAFIGGSVAQALLETGQALQRVGLRAAGNLVLQQEPFHFVGKERPLMVGGGEVSPTVSLIGKVNVFAYADIGHNTILRGEHHEINVGRTVKIGDNCVIVAGNKSVNGLPPTVELGRGCSVGSGSVLESCLVGNDAKIGDNSVVSEGCIIEPGAVLQPGTVVPPLHRIPAKQIWGGNPAKFVADVSDH